MNKILAKVWKLLHLPSDLQLRIMRIVNDEFLIGLTAIIFNEKNEVLLVKHSYRKVDWSLPGGYLKAKEHPIEGLEREIEEETSLTVSIDEPLKVRTDRNTGRLDLCYIGTFIGGEFRPSDEVTECGFFSFENLPIILEDQVFFIKEALAQKNGSHHTLPQVEKPKQTFINKLQQLFTSE